MAFGPDGLLYVVWAMAAKATTWVSGIVPMEMARTRPRCLGKILRLDVDRGSPYAIPADNPFADGKRGRPEIYAYVCGILGNLL
jgi:hypothetical protein